MRQGEREVNVRWETRQVSSYNKIDVGIKK